jgi:phosphonate transport system substrate-binding protein
LDLFSQRNKIDSDTTMSDAEKKSKLAEVDQKLAALK